MPDAPDNRPPPTESTGSPLLDKLRGELDQYTPSERAIASYILSHQDTLAYETASSLADRVGVSAVTVGRFARSLGFKHFKAIKSELKKSSAETMPWLIGKELAQFVNSPGPEIDKDSNFELEVNALMQAYHLTSTPEWTKIVSLLSHSPVVHIAGFQTERGIAMLFANHLQFMRDGVRLVDASAGNYADVFASEGSQSCLVVIDVRRYSRQSFLLAERASQEGIPLIVLTDLFCDWAPKLTPHVLALPTQTGLFWSSPVSLVCTVNLLVNSVIKSIGPGVERRLDRLTQLHQIFTGYVGHPPPGRRQ